MSDPSILVVTPTRHHGGLDITLATLSRQDYRGEMKFLIYDQLWEQRHDEVDDFAMRLGIGHLVHHFPGGPNRHGYMRNLAGQYNKALRIARDEEWDVMISLQDYIALPPDSFEMIVEASKYQTMDLVTSYVHHSREPDIDKVVDHQGGLTIFAEPFIGHPGAEMRWRDARMRHYHDGNIFETSPIEWEANFSLVGSGILREDVWWDEEFDRGVAYENSDFASQCVVRYGSKIWLHTGIHGISLPHKVYFPEMEAEDIPHLNMEMFHAKWGGIIV